MELCICISKKKKDIRQVKATDSCRSPECSTEMRVVQEIKIQKKNESQCLCV